jgi:hypothetical protein
METWHYRIVTRQVRVMESLGSWTECFGLDCNVRRMYYLVVCGDVI